MKFLLPLLLLITSCAGSQQYVDLEVYKKDCLDNNGIFKLTISDYIVGWAPNKAECWYGVNIEEVGKIEALITD